MAGFISANQRNVLFHCPCVANSAKCYGHNPGEKQGPNNTELWQQSLKRWHIFNKTKFWLFQK